MRCLSCSIAPNFDAKNPQNLFIEAKNQPADKGGLILESLSLWLKSPKKEVPNHYSEHYPHKRKDAQDSDLAPFWVDLSQSEKKNLRLSQL